MPPLISDVLTIHALLGLIGAVPGGLRAYVLARANASRARAISDVLIGLVFAASVAEMLTPHKYPAASLLIGMFAGLTGGRTLDALFELVPEVVRVLALGWARKVVGESGERRFRRSTGWGDLQNPDDKEP